MIRANDRNCGWCESHLPGVPFYCLSFKFKLSPLPAIVAKWRFFWRCAGPKDVSKSWWWKSWNFGGFHPPQPLRPMGGVDLEAPFYLSILHTKCPFGGCPTRSGPRDAGPETSPETLVRMGWDGCTDPCSLVIFQGSKCETSICVFLFKVIFLGYILLVEEILHHLGYKTL